MTAKYLAVVGSSDHIKHGRQPVLKKGERDPRPRSPIWEYLDSQPGGWLNSLAYARNDLPATGEQVGDCGAWTYRKERVPLLGGAPLTAARALALYSASRLQAGARVVAPDHMVIFGLGDLEARRAFNRASAREFIGLCVDSPFQPMAAVHGLTIEERVEEAVLLAEIGYHSLALGGLAGQAGRWNECVDAVQAVREAVPGVWLHVLGLAAPSYAREWARIGVNGFDGAAAYLAAFRNGQFYVAEGAELLKYRAVRPGEDPVAPVCHCRACSRLRKQGVDARQYGSNEHNMGRAAHNLNHLMRAIEAAMLPAEQSPVVLVACVKEKASHPMPARFLYSSPWFSKAKRFAERRGGPWYVLSAQHGLVHPDAELAPYDATLYGAPRDARREWGERCAAQISSAVERSRTLEVLAGEVYREYLAPALQRAGYRVTVPMEGMEIGQQLAWLTAAERMSSQQGTTQYDLGL